MEEEPLLFDVCLVCALYEEAQAALDEFSVRCQVSFTTAFRGHTHLEYRHTTIQNRLGEPLRVLITWLSHMGPLRAALDLVALLQESRPRFVVLAGICAGDRNTVSLGDLILVTDAYHPEEGKMSTDADGQLVHWPETRMAGVTTQVRQYIQSFERWREPMGELHRQWFPLLGSTLAEPVSHLGVMASSMAVRADNPFQELTSRYHRKTIGVDMEAASFYLALRDFPLLHGLVVKGVCDYGDSSKNDTYHDYAARASAVYLLAFIQEYVTQQIMPRRETFPPQEQTARSGLWNVPYRRNPHFTGRENLLKRLEQQLSRQPSDEGTVMRLTALTRPQAITGLGGIGKTQIAVEYAYRCREQGHYIHTFWLNADNEEALIASFTALAALLPSFPAKDEQDQRKLIAAIKHWLEQCPQPWLLIVDNANELSIVQDYLPQWGHGSIVFTTRNDAVGALATPLEVETMDVHEARELLLRRAGRFADASDQEIQEAGHIAVALDHFPLALDQAGAYIEETQESFTHYLALYQTHRSKLLARRGRQATAYPDSVATTWLLSFQKIEQANPAAADMLRLCAHLAPDRIPEELITDGAAYWPEPLQPAATNRFCFNEMIETLSTFSLVNRLVEERMLSIHRLVQIVQLDRMSKQEQYQWAKAVVEALSHIMLSAPPENWPRWQRFASHILLCGQYIKEYPLPCAGATQYLLDQTGAYLVQHGQYQTAKRWYQDYLSILEKSPQAVSPLPRAMILINLGNVDSELGEYQEAKQCYEESWDIVEHHPAFDHREFAPRLNNLAILFKVRGEPEEAEALYIRSLRMQVQGILRSRKASEKCREPKKQPSSPADLDIVTLSQVLSLSQEEIYGGIRSLQSKAAATREFVLVLSNLAVLLAEQFHRYETAQRLFSLSLWLQELHPGHDPRDGKHVRDYEYALCLTNYANLCIAWGSSLEALSNKQHTLYKEAEAFYLKSKEMLTKWYNGTNHPDIAYPFHGLGLLSIVQHKYADAEQWLRRSQRIWEPSLLSEHPQVAYAFYNLAILLMKQSKDGEAMPLLQLCHDIWKEKLGEKHVHTKTCEKISALLCSIPGREVDALRDPLIVIPTYRSFRLKLSPPMISDTPVP